MDNKLPINRLVAFAGPYISVLSGAVADWLLVHVHLLELFHTTKTQVAGAITQLVVFGITALLVWAGHHKWLTGWQNWERTIAGPVFNGPDVAPPTGEYDPTKLDPKTPPA